MTLATALASTTASAQQPPPPQDTASFEPREVSAPARAQYNEARTAYAAGHYRRSASLLEAALSLDPAGTNLWFNLGVVRERLGLIDQAITAYQRYQERVSDPAERARTERIVTRLQGARAELLAVGLRRGRADEVFFLTTGAAVASTTLGVVWFATESARGVDPVPVVFTASGLALGVLATVLYFAREVPRPPTYFVGAQPLTGGGAVSVGGRF